MSDYAVTVMCIAAVLIVGLIMSTILFCPLVDAICRRLRKP